MDEIIKMIERAMAEMVTEGEETKQIVGVASTEVAGEIDRINLEAAALKELIESEVMEYTRDRVANARREIDLYMNHAEKRHAPAVDSLDVAQNEAWAAMRAAFNIPTEVPDEYISIDRETREVIVRTPNGSANG